MKADLSCTEETCKKSSPLGISRTIHLRERGRLFTSWILYLSHLLFAAQIVPKPRASDPVVRVLRIDPKANAPLLDGKRRHHVGCSDISRPACDRKVI